VFHRSRTIHARRNPAVVLAAAVVGTVVGTAVGAAVGTVVTRARLSRQLAAAHADAAAWRADALHDPLTGLPNRRAAIAEVTARLADQTPFLLTLIDLDDFKTVNDRYGHLTGDDLLAEVGARLHTAVPTDGFLARLAGDEFLILLPDHGGDPANMLAPVLALLAEPVRIRAATLRPHACAGAATTTGGAYTWRDLLARADQALYRAKTTNCGVAVYDPHLDTPASDAADGDTARRPRVRRRDRHPHRPADVPAAEPER
jgi:diguanylate cyclase (GGDEF)-like protein